MADKYSSHSFPAEGFLTGDYLKEKLTELQKQIPVFCVMDGKEFLKDMPDADLILPSAASPAVALQTEKKEGWMRL